jgi:iron(III) transport system permease protein
VGALTLPSLASLGADLLGASGGHGAIAGALGHLANVLDPDRTPGVLLVMAVVASRLPTLARLAVRGREASRPAPRDAALAWGSAIGGPGEWRRGGTLGVLAGALWLTVALAVTSLAPALLLTPTLETRTVAPGVLILADEPGGGLARAAALASRPRRQSDRPGAGRAGPFQADRRLVPGLSAGPFPGVVRAATRAPSGRGLNRSVY